MKFSIISLFPEVILPYCQSSIVGRGIKNGLLSVETVNPRDFTEDVHHKVDDTPYGGGAGMVMMCEPLMAAYESLLPTATYTRVLLTSPVGVPFTQPLAHSLSQCEQVVILCGHYEGIDARISGLIPQIEPVSIGDFVLTGGELAGLVIVDSVARLIPGVVGKAESIEEESFSSGLLEYPHYTRPAEYRGLRVPDILLSGHHGEIEKWRRQQSLALTRYYRPDLLEKAPLTSADHRYLESLPKEKPLTVPNEGESAVSELS